MPTIKSFLAIYEFICRYFAPLGGLLAVTGAIVAASLGAAHAYQSSLDPTDCTYVVDPTPEQRLDVAIYIFSPTPTDPRSLHDEGALRLMTYRVDLKSPVASRYTENAVRYFSPSQKANACFAAKVVATANGWSSVRVEKPDDSGSPIEIWHSATPTLG